MRASPPMTLSLPAATARVCAQLAPGAHGQTPAHQHSIATLGLLLVGIISNNTNSHRGKTLVESVWLGLSRCADRAIETD
eukprot:14171270-Alexandrium_andersonii.AAC.1